MRRGGFRGAAVLGALLLVWPTSGSSASALAPLGRSRSPVQVSAGDNWFSPNVIDIARGGSVSWNFVGKTHHTATDTTGMDLYDSGSLLTGSFSYTFPAAGTYGFYCILHPEMGGRIHVPMRAKPSTGPRSTVFALTWASESAPAGFVYDVQVKRPGGTYELWQDGVAGSAGSFTPDAGKGTYRFQARLHEVSSGGTSLWSNTLPVSVT